MAVPQDPSVSLTAFENIFCPTNYRLWDWEQQEFETFSNCYLLVQWRPVDSWWDFSGNAWTPSRAEWRIHLHRWSHAPAWIVSACFPVQAPLSPVLPLCSDTGLSWDTSGAAHLPHCYPRCLLSLHFHCSLLSEKKKIWLVIPYEPDLQMVHQ